MPSPFSADTMKVISKRTLSLAAWASASNDSFATRSILLRIRSFGRLTSIMGSRIASASSSRPLRASISNATKSASCAPPHAVVTMARSSRRRGEKMPGVSTKISCASPSAAMPRIRARVVCTLRDTMVTLEPTSALSSVDLPALGAPISATNPQRVSNLLDINMVDGNADLAQHGGGCSLFGGALGIADAFGWRPVWKHHSDIKLRLVVRPCTRDFLISRPPQSTRLCPFLEHRLGVAQRLERLLHAIFPEPLDQFLRSFVAAVEENRADQRLTGIAENRGAQSPAGIIFRTAELERGANVHHPRDIGAGFLA